MSSLNCHQAKPAPTSRLSNPPRLVVGVETCPDRTTVWLALLPLQQFQYELKGISFLPRMELGAYPQMPYEEITQEEYKEVRGFGTGNGTGTSIGVVVVVVVVGVGVGVGVGVVVVVLDTLLSTAQHTDANLQ